MSYLRQAFSSLARIHDSPRRIAFSFSLGVFYGFGPLLGLHTVLGITSAFLFRLNKIAMMLGVWSNLPWLVIPYYAFSTWVGVWMLGVPEGVSLPSVGLTELLTAEFWGWLFAQWKLLIPAFVGSLFLSLALAIAAYPICFYIVKFYKGEGGSHEEY